MIMKLLLVLALLASLCCCRSTLSSHQAILESDPEREKVPGDNPAYYSRERACDQLFRIDDFTVSPNPAKL
jgi:hypothetical protein